MLTIESVTFIRFLKKKKENRKAKPLLLVHRLTHSSVSVLSLFPAQPRCPTSFSQNRKLDNPLGTSH